MKWQIKNESMSGEHHVHSISIWKTDMKWTQNVTGGAAKRKKKSIFIILFRLLSCWVQPSEYLRQLVQSMSSFNVIVYGFGVYLMINLGFFGARNALFFFFDCAYRCVFSSIFHKKHEPATQVGPRTYTKTYIKKKQMKRQLQKETCTKTRWPSNECDRFSRSRLVSVKKYRM